MDKAQTENDGYKPSSLFIHKYLTFENKRIVSPNTPKPAVPKYAEPPQ